MRIGFAALWVSVLAAQAVAAQTTGKIAGMVTDAVTGEPLPGVNILVEGTQQGTASDLEGRFVIIGVRPGTYTVVASFIGFATQRSQGLRVSVDLTTEVNFILREQTFEGEEVVVMAEAVRVRKDVTSSEARVTAETIDRLPVQELGQILNVQAGVTDRGGFHIRGGRSSEIVTMVDGVPVTDSYDGSTALQLENDGIEELQVISGTFNAEFGNAMSGIINVVSKEGRKDRLGGSVELYSGSYVVPGTGGRELLLGTRQEEYTSPEGFPYDKANVYSYLPVAPLHYRNATVSLEGPMLSDRISFFANGRYFNNDGWLYGANLYEIDGTYGDSSLVSLNAWNKTSFQANVRIQATESIIVNLIALGSRTEGAAGGYQFYRWNPSGMASYRDNGLDTKIKFTHLLGAKTFYTLNIATFVKSANRRRFGDLADDTYNDFSLSPPDSVEVFPGVYDPVELGGNRFARGGVDLNRFERRTRSYFVKGDLTSQIARYHLVKVGFEGRLDNLSYEDYNIIPASSPTGRILEPFVPAAPRPESFQYRSFKGVEPITLSAYVQDKIEYENFIVNAGLRVDYFNARASVPADPEDPNIHGPLKKINLFRDTNGDGVIMEEEETDGNAITMDERQAYWWSRVDSKVQVSPRLGVAYPVTEEGVIHFSWGHFLQIPTLNRLFDNFGYKVPRESGQYGPFGNPDLSAQHTVMYEVGIKQALGPVVAELTAYSRDVRSWVSTSRLIETELPGVSYVVYANRDYANTRGVTLSVERAYVRGFGFNLNYTYQVVEGSNSSPEEEFFAASNQEEPRLALLPLAWDQRHKVAGAFFAGGRNWGASLLAIWGAGFPYTPSFEEAAITGNDVPPEFPTHARRQPSTLQLDLDAFRTFTLGPVRPRIFVQVTNVLDRRNANSVFADTGLPDITFNAPINSADAGFFARPNYFSEPRRIHAGIKIRY